MINFVDNYCEFPSFFRKPMWRIWHKLLIKFDNDKSVNFMNYGYAGLNGDKKLVLEKEDEPNRYCIQLYDHIINKADLKGKKILEVGSGRGGGAHYISRYYHPESYTGVDISSGVIDFCNSHYNFKGLSFITGRAEKLPVKSNYYDALINVESARCYNNLDLFFREVFRVLKPGGHFLFADMIEKDHVDTMKKKLLTNGFKILEFSNITDNVAKGLEMDTSRRQLLIKNKIPAILQKSFESFAGTQGTRRFDSFRNGKFTYMSFVMRKKGKEDIQLKTENLLKEDR